VWGFRERRVQGMCLRSWNVLCETWWCPNSDSTETWSRPPGNRLE
jgi:hypothetical protein